MIVYLNGKYIDASDAAISVADRGFTLGDGVFETLFYDGAEIECLEPHFNRLVKGAEVFQIPFHLVISDFKALLLNVIDRNNFQGISTALRFTLTRGRGERGLKIPHQTHPTQLITAVPYQRQSPIMRVGFSQYIHQSPSQLTGVKHLGYQLSVLGKIEAENRGLDDVLFFNQNGYLVSATAANVFIVKERELITPPLTDGCLPGIMRGKIIQEMHQTLTPVRIDHICRQDVESASKILLTNSLIGSVVAIYQD